MRDQPEPSEREEEMTPEVLQEAEAMQYPRHDDPKLPGDRAPEERVGDE